MNELALGGMEANTADDFLPLSLVVIWLCEATKALSISRFASAVGFTYTPKAVAER